MKKQQDSRSLAMMRPFFDGYEKLFIKSFLGKIKPLIDETGAATATTVSRYIYLKHFHPTADPETNPKFKEVAAKLDAPVKTAYKRFLRERGALDQSVTDMEVAFDKYLVAMAKKRKAVFKGFTERVIQEIADTIKKDKETGLQFEEVSFDRLHRLLQNWESVNCYNVYKGIPISKPAKILKLDKKNGSLTLKLHPYQLVPIYSELSTYLVGHPFKSPLFCKFSHLDPLTLVVVFQEFRFFDRPLKEREHVRVQLEGEKLEVRLSHGGEIIVCTLFDISLGGVGITSSRNDLERLGAVNLEIDIEKNKKFQISGNVRFKFPQGPGIVFYGISFQTDRGIDVKLGQLIYEFQARIIRELRTRVVDLQEEYRT